MERILLFSHRNDSIKVTIEAFFDKDGNLVIDGYDIGKTVNEYWGDSDYEYSSRVTADGVEKLYLLFSIEAGKKMELLQVLAAKFNTNSCYSDLQKFFDLHGIRYAGFSWK